MTERKDEMPNLKSILTFLHKIAAAKKIDPLDAVVEYMNSELVLQLADTVTESMCTSVCPEFTEYFMDRSGIDRLKKMKESDESMYYSIINYQNVFMGLVNRILNMPYVIVLTPEDLCLSYYVKLKFKTEDD